MPANLVRLLCSIAVSRRSEWRGNFDARLDRQSSSLRIGAEIATIYHRVFREFENLDESRWYDPYHILFSTGFALRLVWALGDSIPGIDLIIPAVLLHDVGYYAVQDKTKWSGRESRIVHMQEGAARSARVLWECGGRLKPGEIEDIIGMIAVHDNPYIGIPIGPAPLRQALRDCDRVWVIHALSFYKDWHHKKDKYLGRSEGIGDFLADRTVQFYRSEVPESLARRIHQPLPALVERNQQRVEKPHYPLTKKFVGRLIERRWEEIGYILGQYQDICEGLENRMDYLEERIDGDFGLLDTL